MNYGVLLRILFISRPKYILPDEKIAQIKRVERKLPEVVRKCEKIVGVQTSEWKVKNMRTKWGSCNIDRKRSWLNLQLAKKTPEFLAYVVTHELVHLLERNHNEPFQKYMDSFFPDWHVVKSALNQQMLDYMSE